MDEVTAVIVSYRKDLDNLKKCLYSLVKHGQQLKKIIVVVNDTHDVVAKVKLLLSPDMHIEVVHHSEIANWDRDLDWWSQQYFKLAVSKQIQTKWYLLIDSDNLIVDDLCKETLFDQDRAFCRMEDLWLITNNNNDALPRWLTRACSIFDVCVSKYTMGNLTPFMMHTETARQVFDCMPADCFNTGFSNSLTLEFYLYYAYLLRYDLFNQLYTPTKRLHYSLDKSQQ